jgi:BlaI family transcriptional regulator, penicillinase repressor
MMTKQPHHDLSRRERQIIDILYAQGRATAAEVQAALPEPPSYSAVRAMLRILEDKGHVRHEQDGPRYVYVPTVGRDNAKRSALNHMLQTFFEGSAEQAISALLDDRAAKLSDAELDRLSRLINQARKAGA